jgi:hypothetical protein
MGVPLPLPVRVQLQMRAAKNAVVKATDLDGAYDYRRDTDNIKYLANKTGWIRLVSSVDVIGNDLEWFKMKVPYLFANTVATQAAGINIKDKASLAKAFVLSSGTSIYQNDGKGFSYAFREGLDGFKSAYGNIASSNDVKEYGYRPMPGITDVKIQTQGRLGSVRQATINFKVWTKDQLDIIDTLYFKMGYHMFLEWGHVYYYDNEGKLKEMGSTIDPFELGLTKEQILINITKMRQATDCNYDAMLGMCTHFTFTFNQEAGYDCTIKLIGLGTLADSMKINSISGIPDIEKKEIDMYYSAYRIYKENQALAEKGLTQAAQSQKSTFGTSDSFLAENKIDSANESKYAIKASNSATKPIIIPVNSAGIKYGALYLKDKSIVIPANSTAESKYYNGVILNKSIWDKVRDAAIKSLSQKGYADEQSARESFLKSRTRYTLPGNVSIAWSDNSSIVYAFNAFDGTDGVKSIEYHSAIGKKLVEVTIRSVFDGFNYDFNITLYDNELDNEFFKYDDAGYLRNEKWKVNALAPTAPSADIFGRSKLEIQGDEGFGNNKANQFNEIILKDNADSFLNYVDAVVRYALTTVPKGSGKDYQVSNINLSINQNYSSAGYKYALTTRNDLIKIQDVGNTDYKNSTNEQKSTISLTTYQSGKYYNVIKKALNELTGKEVDAPFAAKFKMNFTTNDPAIISDIDYQNNPGVLQEYLDKKKAEADSATAKAAEEQRLKDIEETKKQVDTAIKEEGFKYASAIESALRIIQMHSLNDAVGDTNNPNFDFRQIQVSNLMKSQSTIGSIAEAVFSNSIFKDKIKSFVENSNIESDKINNWVLKGLDPDANQADRLLSFAAYGFNHNLMASQNPKEFVINNKLKTCDFAGMFKTYVVPYDINQQILPGTDSAHPAYIRFDLFLFLLNSMCLLYDTKATARSQKALTANKTNDNSSVQTPILYIDFNTHTNTCLSAPIQMSIDVLKFLIPFRGTLELYKTLFNDEHLKAIDEASINSQKSENVESNTELDRDLAKVLPKLFDPKNDDAISASLPEFKSAENADKAAWSGKIMNIVVGIDYLLTLFQHFSSNDDSNSVNLRPFVQQILSDMNKSFGDINYFRFAYKDESNCMYITDDQVSPVMDTEDYPIAYTGNRTNTKYGDLEMDPLNIELPLYGRRSIAKSVEIKTEVSSKLSNMLAISANADKKVASGKNSTAFGQYNENYINRYVEQTIEPNKDADKILEGERNAAIAFNDYVFSIFKQDNPKLDQTPAALNYYIEKMNGKIAEYQATRASAMIPVSVNFQTDGISGLSMGQAFTIPEQLLPRTYQRYENENGVRVGFVMSGVEEDISSNTWNTSVKAQMFFMKKESDYKIDKKLYNIDPLAQAQFEGQSNITNSNYGSPSQYGKSGNFKAAIEALPDAASFKVKVEAFASKYGTSSENFYRIMYAESGIRPDIQNSIGATGLIQFMPTTAIGLGTTVDELMKMSATTQMDYVEKYFSKAGIKNGATVYDIYALTFFPIIAKHSNDDSWIIRSSDLSAELISKQNPGIARAAGKSAGTPLNVGDFKKYVNSIS